RASWPTVPGRRELLPAGRVMLLFGTGFLAAFVQGSFTAVWAEGGVVGGVLPCCLGHSIRDSPMAEIHVAELIGYLTHPDAAVRRWAAERLGTHPCIDSERALISQLKDRDASVRYSVVKALQELFFFPVEVASVAALIETSKDESWVVRRGAVEVLRKMGSAFAVPPLVDMLKNRASTVRHDAAVALA